MTGLNGAHGKQDGDTEWRFDGAVKGRTRGSDCTVGKEGFSVVPTLVAVTRVDKSEWVRIRDSHHSYSLLLGHRLL